MLMVDTIAVVSEYSKSCKKNTHTHTQVWQAQQFEDFSKEKPAGGVTQDVVSSLRQV
jgi:hypothetical protein